MKVPFVGSFGEARSKSADAELAINCYLEFDQGNPRAAVALYGTPGLVSRFTLGSGPIRGSIRQGNVCYFVSGNQVYEVSATYTTTLLGTISTNGGPVGMATNGTETIIVDGVGGWLATAGLLTQITDVDFPNGVRRAAYQDGYFMVTGDDTEQWYINEIPGSGSGWNGADFASAEGSPDNTVGIISNQREVWLVGEDSAEVWVNTGNTDFPFERSGNTFIEIGCAAAATLDKLDNTVFWLSRNENGGAMVVRAQGYQPQRVSTHALEHAMQGYATVSDAYSFTFQMEGHSFYALTFPTGNASWLYDASTNEWTQWAWRDPNTGTLHRHRAATHVYFGNAHLVGDWETGEVYELSMDAYDDAGDPMLFLRRTQTLDAPGGERNFYEELIVDMEAGVGLAVGQGSDPKMMLRYSNDSGQTWSGFKTKSIGRAGEYARQVRFGPLGAGRNRVWEISISDPVKRAVIGAYLRATRGAS